MNNLPRVPSLHGIVQHTVFGHLKAQHEARAHPGVMQVFADFWGCDTKDLLTSNDALALGHPGANSGKPWLHFDCAYLREGIWQVQGQLALTKQGPGLGCLRVREKSHLAWRAFADQAERFKDQAEPKARSQSWNMLTEHELKTYFPESEFPTCDVTAEAGSLILWFSHTLHQGNTPSVKGVERNVFYICQVPRNHLPIGEYDPETKQVKAIRDSVLAPYKKKLADGLQKKREHFVLRRMTTHCPDLPHLFGTKPRTYGDEALEVRLHNFSIEVEERGLGAVPYIIARESSSDEGGGEPKEKKQKTSKTPVYVPDILLDAVRAIKQGSLERPVDALPLSIRSLSDATRDRLWRLNGF